MAAIAASGVVGGNGFSSSWMKFRGRRERNNKVNMVKVCCSYSSAVMDPYKTLRIQPGASESEVRKAFRQLALQYHPDVCRGSNCGVQFYQINEAYDVVMANLRGESNETQVYEAAYDAGIDEPLRGMNDPDWDMWEEWMGWEGAGIRDYSSHDCDVSVACSLVSALPPPIRRQMSMKQGDKVKLNETGRIVHDIAIRSREEAANCLQRILKRKVMASSARQAISGLLATGGMNATRYLAQKVSKAWKSWI